MKNWNLLTSKFSVYIIFQIKFLKDWEETQIKISVWRRRNFLEPLMKIDDATSNFQQLSFEENMKGMLTLFNKLKDIYFCIHILKNIYWHW